MSTDPGQFEDPVLQTAVKRLYAQERAPAALRERIAATMAGTAGETSMRLDRRPSGWISLFTQPYGLALAASLAVVAIAGAYMAWLRPVSASDIGQTTLAAMVQTHDRCCEHADHFMAGIPKDGCRSAGEAIQRQLRETVLAANLVTDGWEYRGAGICPVGEVRSAHLVYARGEQRLSVFSLPASLCSEAKEGNICVKEVNGHVIAGLVRTGGVYSMVGHCPKNSLKAEEIVSLFERHQGEMVGPGIALTGDRPLQQVVAARSSR